ncbi:MAG: NADP-dependent isocitrate dehydrogenase [Acidobacteriota bacterium]|nr:NADP-dependent isocitrate dehydrogenase [Acidobacteriota bacterium]
MKIIYTYTDEAPALASGSLLPIVQAFANAADVEIETRDISLAGRILAQFPDRLSAEQFTADALTELGELAKTPDANIIKLPNISASLPQLKAAIRELQDQGFDLPDYPDAPDSDEQRDVRASYDRVKGSAVNPVLREGNSDRRAPASVKAYARKHPHSMGGWSAASRSHVSTMHEGDFRATERSVTVTEPTTFRIEHVAHDGSVTLLRPDAPLLAGEVLDGAVMRAAALNEFLAEQIRAAQAQGLLYSVHLKATMMKVSDPIIFGHAVTTFFPELTGTPGWNPNDGLGALPPGKEIPQADGRPALAMVDSDRGITNLHVPSDVIIDASMPAAIRASGQMWNAAGDQQDTLFVIPDHSYAALYAETIEDCKLHGAFDPATMGTTPNVGLMAQAAEEYGSHDKTFELDAPGRVRVVGADGNTLIEHEVAAGDIWRACQTKDAPIQDWVRLAVTRARATGMPAVFWLDETRGHDAELLKKVRAALEQLDTSGLRIEILPVAEATRFTLARARAGEDTISVTGNVLRDYLTDLFPILELGTSAKMLSIVPLMDGGGMF